VRVVREDDVERLEEERRRRQEQELAQMSKKASGNVVDAGPIKREGDKVGRNAACPCGSGKKYKRCCGKEN